MFNYENNSLNPNRLTLNCRPTLSHRIENQNRQKSGHKVSNWESYYNQPNQKCEETETLPSSQWEVDEGLREKTNMQSYVGESKRNS